MDVLGDPNIAAHQAKQILGYKSIGRMIDDIKPIGKKFSRLAKNGILAYIEYDEEGYAKPVLEGETFDCNNMYEQEHKVKTYTTKIIIKYLTVYNEKDCKEFLDKLLISQPTIMKTILSGKNCVQLFKFIVEQNKCSVAKFFVDFLANSPRLKRCLETLSEHKTNNIRLFKLLRDVIKIRYEKDETEMRWIDEPADCETIHNLEYLWLNENFDIVKHYFEFIDEELITDSLSRLQGFSDAGFYFIHNYIDNHGASMYSHLTFKSNFMRCFQIIYGKDIKSGIRGKYSRKTVTLRKCFPEFSDYNSGGYVDEYYSAASIRDSRVLEKETLQSNVLDVKRHNYFLSAVFYKLIKNSPNCCVPSKNIIYILRVFMITNNDFFLQSAEMLFANFFCVVDPALLNFICTSDIENPYIRITLNSIDSKAAKVHSCENETCPFRASRRSKR
jgi:hypothetical protein